MECQECALSTGEELLVASHAKRILTFVEYTPMLPTVAASKSSRERGDTHTHPHTSTHKDVVTVSYLR